MCCCCMSTFFHGPFCFYNKYSFAWMDILVKALWAIFFTNYLKSHEFNISLQGCFWKLPTNSYMFFMGKIIYLLTSSRLIAKLKLYLKLNWTIYIKHTVSFLTLFLVRKTCYGLFSGKGKYKSIFIYLYFIFITEI